MATGALVDVRARRRASRLAIVAASVIATTACAPDPPAAVVGLVIDGCSPGQEVGSGMIVAPDLALTSAHVVAGAREIVVRHAGGENTASIVGFDPDMDLAYVSFDAPPVAVPPIDSSDVEAGDDATVWVVRDGAPVPVPVTIERRINIRTEDIYIEGETLRPGFELAGEIVSGDSGGAVVVDGRVVGVIWARSNRSDRRAYAIDPVRAGDVTRDQLRSGDLGDDVDITRC